MAEKLTFRYDKIGAILYIGKCQPYPEQESEEIGIVILINFVVSVARNLPKA